MIRAVPVALKLVYCDFLAGCPRSLGKPDKRSEGRLPALFGNLRAPIGARVESLIDRCLLTYPVRLKLRHSVATFS